MFAPVEFSKCIQGRLLSRYCKTLWYFNKNPHVLGLIHAHWKQQCFFPSHQVICGQRMCENGWHIFWWKVFFFFYLLGKKILHEWRHVTKHDDVWLGYKRKESTRGARAGVWKRSRFCQWNRNSPAPPMFGHRRGGPRGRRWHGQLWRASFFSKSGGSVNQTGSVLMLCWVCMLSPRRWQAWPRLASWASIT